MRKCDGPIRVLAVSHARKKGDQGVSRNSWSCQLLRFCWTKKQPTPSAFPFHPYIASSFLSDRLLWFVYV